MTLLFLRGFRRRWALLLVLSILPFLTLSLALHVLRSSDAYLSGIMLDAFGVIPSAILLFLLLALEVMLLFVLPRGFGRAAAEASGGTIAGSEGPDDGADLTPAILRLGAASKIGPRRSGGGRG